MSIDPIRITVFNPGPASISTATSREQIYTALFEMLQTVVFPTPIMGKTTWSGYCRKYIDPAQISVDMNPFMAQYEGGTEIYEQHGERLWPHRTLIVYLYCWTRVDSGDAQELGTQYLTSMLEGIENTLGPESQDYGANDKTTLGGLVQWCRIQGNILKFPGDYDNQAMLRVPVRILWP